MRLGVSVGVVLLLAGLGCPATGQTVVAGPGPPGPDPKATRVAAAHPETKEVAAPKQNIPPDRRVWAYIGGQRKLMDVDEARSYGLTIVDLSDDWVPYIFWSRTPGKDDYSRNHYFDFYVALANDKIDVDGVALSKHERNYLEVYGIPPSLSVLRRRFIADEKKECFKELDLEPFSEYHGSIRVGDPAGSERELKRFYGARANYKRAKRKARVSTLEQLLKVKKYRQIAEKYQKYSWRHKVLTGMQKRLVCEGMFGPHKPRLKPGIITWATRQALKQFERKHDVYGWGLLFQNTVDALGRTPLQNNFESLKRALTARVVGAARILEDGTAGSSATYKDKDGKVRNVRNLVKEYSESIWREMGLTDPDKAMAFMQQYTEKDFGHLWVGVRLPPRPEYYSDNMDLSVVIDRGDVWYDFPNKFNSRGRLIYFGRNKYPHLTLRVTHNGQTIPLVRWRTTVGSWQAEIRHDQEYYKFKISDVGPRVWRHIVAGPVWVPPKNTPSRDMVKIRPVRGQSQRIVAHQSFGPGYASAYGLVAAFHVTPKGFHDNQVRTHGTVNYMSIKSSNGYSHGCHRLYNFRAVRLFSFVLAHRPFKRKGQSRLSYAHRYEHRGEEYQTDLWTRGYYYEMTPSVPVNVLEGNIKGERQRPIEEYIKKPTVVYQEDLPTLNKKSHTGAPRVKPKKPKGGLMSQPQNL